MNFRNPLGISNQISFELFDAVSSNDVRRVRHILKDTSPSFDFGKLTNSQMESLLHTASECAGMVIVQLIIAYFMENIDMNAGIQQNAEQKLVNFINQQNSEGFTAIHLASFAGKLDILEFLYEKGGSITIQNAAGLTAMHTSAQGDQVAVMLYLRMKGLSIEQKDHNGRTPLHWAAFQSATNAVAFLLSWGAKIEESDSDNMMTGLHYAVISGSTTIVRKLLLAGADRHVEDKDNLTPLAHAKEKDMDMIASMLSAKPGLSEMCNLKQPFEKLRKKKRLLIVFALLYLTTLALSVLFAIPYVASKEMIIVFSALSLLTLIFFLCSWLCDPGYLKQTHKSPELLLNILKSVEDFSLVCAKCELIYPERSKHCDICGHCVRVYDHHCPWINNCVGANNFKYFYMFILLIFVQLGFQIVFHSIYLTRSDPIDSYIFQIFESRQVMEDFHLATSIYCCLMCLFFLICVGILLFVQTENLLSGMTTNEKFGFKSQKNKKKQQITPIKKKKKKERQNPAMNYSVTSESGISSILENDNGNSSTNNGSSIGDNSFNQNDVSHDGDGEEEQEQEQEVDQENQSHPSVWSNMLNMCFRNGSNPKFGVDPLLIESQKSQEYPFPMTGALVKQSNP